MFSEPNRHIEDDVSPAQPQNFKGNTSQRAGNKGVRLSPLPARNTLLTIIFFSALAVAILYWILFPPSPAQLSENSPPSNTEPAEQR